MHCFVLLVVDLVLVSMSTLIAVVVTMPGPVTSAIAAASAYGAFTLSAAIPVMLIFGLNRTVWRFTSLGDGVRVAAAVVWIVALTTALAFVFDQAVLITPNLLILQSLLILYALIGVRVATRIRHDRRRRARGPHGSIGGFRKNVLIVGLSPQTDIFLYGDAKDAGERTEIVGILSPSRRHRGRRLRSRKILGTPDAVCEVLHDLAVHGVFVDRIVVALPPAALSEKAQAALVQLRDGGMIRVDWLPPRYGLREGADAAIEAAANGLEPSFNAYLPWKRFIDATAALVGIVVFAPLMLVVAMVVLLDVGAPAIFWQQRPGARGNPIKVLKFRTMGPPRDRAGRALTDAERVSTVGRLLRRLRLDELPQIYNVLVGDMSFVGPRPLLPVDQPSAPAARLCLRPGLTGWAQIKGGRDISSEDKAALDLWYIRNASFTLDVKILAQTARMVLFGERVDRNAIQEAWQAIRNDQPSILSADIPEHNLV
ncbi:MULTISPECIES: sugar transferase [unclassified Hyphomicrobium]|uniref:sugar transferase n=1 Tax=unclassified Hyphomicrobium TaxID=2619925 RepID=UPI000213DB21|nr:MULTISPECIES: sugar transferase [unclassified Hyphomicrobium]CCB66345.1 Sugar transferase [Hyphomicrobium sp. MC1]